MSWRENEEDEKNHNNHCCISHEFLNVATKNPNKVAVIHALSGERQRILTESTDSSISHEFLNAATKNPNKVVVIHALSGERQQLLMESTDSSSSSHLVYEGGCSLSFADISTSEESLASRINSILGSSDDPHLIKPSTKVIYNTV